VPTTRFWNSFLQIHSTYIKFNVVMFDSSDLVCPCSIFTHSYLFLQLRNMDLKVFIVISSLCWKYNANDGCLQWSRNCLLLWSIWVHHRVLVWSWCSIFSFLCGVCRLFPVCFFWPLWCLSFLDSRLLITPLVSLSFSYYLLL
jgi:hypothetical protein